MEHARILPEEWYLKKILIWEPEISRLPNELNLTLSFPYIVDFETLYRFKYLIGIAQRNHLIKLVYTDTINQLNHIKFYIATKVIVIII